MEERTELIRTSLFNMILFLTIVLANFIIAIISTRKLTPQEFGTYQFLIIFSSYFLIFSLTLGWFATRFTARKINIIREVLVYSFIIIILSSLIFLIILYLVNERVINIGYDSIILILFFMITMQIINVFLGIGYGYNVLISTLGNFLQSIVRLIVLVIIIYLLFVKISIFVILLTFIFSNLLVIVYFSFTIQAIKNYKKEGKKFKETVNRLWFFPFLTFLIGSLTFYDAAIVTLALSNTLPLAYFRTAFIISNVVNYVQSIFPPFYKKYLETISPANILLGIKILSIYLFLVSPLIIALGEHLLAILRLDYLPSYNALVILTIGAVLGNFAHFFNLIIQAKEKETEVINKDKFLKLVKIDLSSLTLQYIVLAIVLIIAKIYGLNSPFIAFLWSLAWLSFSINSFILRYKIFVKEIQIKIPLNNIIKYAIPGIISGIILYIIKPKFIALSFLESVINVVLYSFIYLLIFSVIIYFLDRKIIYKIFSIIFKDILGK